MPRTPLRSARRWIEAGLHIALRGILAGEAHAKLKLSIKAVPPAFTPLSPPALPGQSRFREVTKGKPCKHGLRSSIVVSTRLPWCIVSFPLADAARRQIGERGDSRGQVAAGRRGRLIVLAAGGHQSRYPAICRSSCHEFQGPMLPLVHPMVSRSSEGEASLSSAHSDLETIRQKHPLSTS